MTLLLNTRRDQHSQLPFDPMQYPNKTEKPPDLLYSNPPSPLPDSTTLQSYPRFTHQPWDGHWDPPHMRTSLQLRLHPRAERSSFRTILSRHYYPAGRKRLRRASQHWVASYPLGSSALALETGDEQTYTSDVALVAWVVIAFKSWAVVVGGAWAMLVASPRLSSPT
jgi:hypothetical protein